MAEVYSVFNEDRRHLLAGRISVAGTSGARKRGLLAVDALDSQGGLWIAPCEAVHTFGMKMPIDVIFLDRQLRVTRLVPHLSPWRVAVSLRAHSVLELQAGAIARAHTRLGDHLRFTPANTHQAFGDKNGL